MNAQLDSFTYDDDIVRKFLFATFIWGLIGMLVGLIIALQLAYPVLNFGPMLSFGRLRVCSACPPSRASCGWLSPA